MSFITRCPACATSFKVVADQLKISDGWVRCGHCHQIFDATLDLQPWWPGQPDTDTPPAKPKTPEPASGHTPAQVPSVAPAPAPVPPAEPEALPEEPHPPAPDFEPTQVIEPPAQSLPPLDLPDSPEPVTEAQPEVGAEPLAQAPAVAQPPAVAERVMEPEPPSRPMLGDREPSFVRQAQRRALWRKPWVRVTLLLLVMALAALLAFQVAIDRRDQLASHLPAARPALEALCAPLDCKVESPRQLEDIVIDSSILLRRAHGQYSFNVVIRNRSDREVAMPAIELTLTDIQDQILVRRVLPPEEWPRTADTLGPGSEWSLQFDLALDHPRDQVMTGFRAILFYP